VEVLKLLTGRADKHVPHEEGMVGASADDTDADTVLLVPAGVAIDDVDAVAGVEVVDSTFAVDLPDLDLPLLAWLFMTSAGYDQLGMSESQS
jgi:hypothetical protein